MTNELPFSERNGYEPRRIVFREELDDVQRQPLIEIVRKSAPPAFLNERIGHVFNPYGTDQLPEGGGVLNAGHGGEEFAPVKRVLLGCPWFRLYDFIEDLYRCLEFHDRELADLDDEPQAYRFQQSLNRYFVHAGIGWKLVAGQVVARNDEAFEAIVETAKSALVASNRPTASGRIQDALQALSRRPSADCAGAISHAMAALECVARDLTGDGQATLGIVLKRHPGLVPKPLDEALSRIWGYASEQARHGREGSNPDRRTAELIVGVAAAVATFLAKKDA